MSKILDHTGVPGLLAGTAEAPAATLRRHLRAMAQRAAAGLLPVRAVAAAASGVARGQGHFHLAPELFMQVAGWTRFQFPQGELHLAAGEALVMPPRLLHDERVGTDNGGAVGFCNLVVLAEPAGLTCHLAHEQAPGRPGILHPEASRHPQVARIHGWLTDVVRLAQPAADSAAVPSPWAATQCAALVAAAVVGVLRALDEPDPAAAPEPALVSRVRALVQNQLGDQALSVRRLAEQTGYTADYLSHQFSRSAGEHLAAHIVRQRLARAAHLLSETTMAGKEVAWACGFATPGYFIRSFKAQFGLTPQAWRQRRGPAGL